MIKNKVLFTLIAAFVICSQVLAENLPRSASGELGSADWPHWRGPFMNGSSVEVNLPTEWSTTKNVAWVAGLPGTGSATPVIYDGKVFISSADSKSDDLLAFCFDEKTGQQLWKKKIAESDRSAPRNNLAAPSAVTDGKLVFFMYGSGDLAALDYEGKIIWSRNIEEEFGNISQKYGYSSSPLLFEGKLYIQVLRRDSSYRSPQGENLDSFLLAVNANTGKNIWKQIRVSDVTDESLDSYSSPILYKNSERTEILIIGASYITSHDPDTGKELWRYKYPEDPKSITKDRTITSLVTGEGLIFGIPPRGNLGLIAISSGREGLLSDDAVVWRFEGPAPDCSTPLYYKGCIYVLADRTNGVLSCLDAKSGLLKWQGELGGSDPWWGSLTAGEDKMYCISESAEAVVLATGGDEFKVISRIDMEDGPAQGSIAIANSKLFIHTNKKLFCIKEQ